MPIYQLSFTHEGLGADEVGQKPAYQEFVNLTREDARWIRKLLAKLEQSGAISDPYLSTTLKPAPIDVEEVREMFISVFPTVQTERR